MDAFENFEEEVFNAQKKVAQLEEELDQAATNIKLSTERAEENDKVIVDWELQITALNRRISLLVTCREILQKTALPMLHSAFLAIYLERRNAKS